MVLQALPVHRVRLDLLVRWVYRGRRVNPASRAHQDRKVQEGRRAHRVNLDLKASRVRREIKDRRD
jgi:hypothetical protein